MRKLLNEKYRPTTLDEYIFKDETIKRKVESIVKSGEVPNLLLSGPPGTGKSSLARLLVNLLDIDGNDLKIVNSSMDSGIDFVRNVLDQWVRRGGFGMKIILMEEFERFTPDAQKALKMLIEDCSDHVRVFATSNNISKIDPAIYSRFQHFVLDTLDVGALQERILDIIEGEGIELANDSDDDLLSHIECYYPDMRKIINSIDQCTVDGLLYPCEDNSAFGGADDWENIWREGKAPDSIKELLELTENIDQTNFEWFYEVMYNNIQDNISDQDGLSDAIIRIADYLHKATTTPNHRLNMDACILSIFCVGD